MLPHPHGPSCPLAHVQMINGPELLNEKGVAQCKSAKVSQKFRKSPKGRQFKKHGLKKDPQNIYFSYSLTHGLLA